MGNTNMKSIGIVKGIVWPVIRVLGPRLVIAIVVYIILAALYYEIVVAPVERKARKVKEEQ